MTDKMKAKAHIFLISLQKPAHDTFIQIYLSYRKLLQNISIDCDEKNKYIPNIFEISNVFEIMLL